MGERRVTSGYKHVRWTNAMKERFFDALGETCNVKLAAEVAGVGQASVYSLKRKDGYFAEEWRKALECGYEVLETRMVGLALDKEAEGEPLSNTDIELGLKLLTKHRNAMLGRPQRGSMKIERATQEETDAAILKKIRMIEKARKDGVA